MQTYIPQPPSLKGDERAQLEQMYRYLYKMSEQLNTALAVTDKEYQIVVQTKSGSAPGSESPITPQLDAQYRELRSLIIKTADIVNQQMDKTIKQLNGKFEAISSEWGTFEQNIERKIVETAEATIDSFDYSEKIHGIEKTVLNGVTSYAIESLGYIKRGIIGFDDENFPIYGIAVGTELKEKTVEKDGKTYQQIDTTKRIATYTSDAITFWRNDVAIARFSGDELYVTRAEITQQIRLGDWFFNVSESGGLNISKRLGSAIDISENGTITSLVGDIDEANTSISQTQNAITALAKRTSIAEDKISSTESKLELKADSAALNVVQENVDGLSGRVGEAESKLELKADSATLSVMETNLKQYTNDAVDNISVGGRNLLRGTNQSAANWSWSMQTGGKTIEEYLDGGVRAVKMTRDAVEQTGWSVITYAVSEDTYALLEPNTEYTLSFDYKPSVASTDWITFSIKRANSSNAATNSASYPKIPANEWTHVSGTFTTVENIPDFLSGSTVIYITGFSSAVNSVHIFKNLKLEKGNKSTDWSPAPEDIEGDVSALERRMSTAEQKITADAIVSTVTSSTSYKTLSSKADGNATDITGLKTRMTTAESKIDQKADSITLSVLETKVDGIAVGGRNLLLGTEQPITTPAGNNTTNQTTYLYYTTTNSRPQAKEAIIVSCDVQASSGATGKFFLQYTDANNHYGQISPVLNVADYTTKKHVVYTISNPSLAFAVMFIRRDNATGTITISNAKLEKGNKATDWSPAPEDPAGSLSVNSDYSKVEITKNQVKIVSREMEVAVPSEDGEDDVLRVDADGVHAEVVEADVIVSESVVRTQGAASYTPANAGELAAILTELSGKHLTGSVSINCKNVSSGSFSIDRISGGGYISLNNGTMNALEITNCGASVVVYLSRITFSTSGTALTISNAHEVYVDSCTFNAGVGVHLGSGWPSQAYMASCAGDCATMAQVALMSRLCICGASKPTGTVSLNYGGEVYNATSDPSFTAKADPSLPATQTVTVSLSPTQTYTLRGTSNSDGNKLYQGRYSSSQSLRKGVMLFSLPSDLTSADKIDSATLTIRRIGGVGQGGGVSVHVRCYDVPGTLYASKTAYDGQTVSIDVTSAVKAMKTNGYTGLMLYNPDTTTAGSKPYTASYARFAGKGESGAPVLKVSYRK